MRKSYYFILFFYSFLVLAVVIQYVFSLFGFQWQTVLGNFETLQKFIFFIFFLTLSLTILLLLIMKFVQIVTLTSIRRNIRNILDGQKIEVSNQEDIDYGFEKIVAKMALLTENLQKSENQVLQNEEVIVEKERRRIARDLHDTVSQELFAANMILSGVSGQLGTLEREVVEQQIKGVSSILDTAQKDLRILLLHLRPTELEGRSLVEGLEVILKELVDKSEIEVNFEHRVGSIPRQIEEHIFRIAQEIISNTLRHAKASRLDVYLYQNRHEVQLKMADNGIGFHRKKLDEISYGLKNIEERVHDMAGEIQILTAPKQGVAIDIRVPLLDRNEN
jgi:histidine kinase